MRRPLVILLLALIVLGGVIAVSSYNDRQEAKKYLIFKEWGVGFKPPEKLKDRIKYVMVADDTEGMRAHLRPAGLSNKPSGGQPASPAELELVIARSRGDQLLPVAIPPNDTYKARILPLIGGYQYYWSVISDKKTFMDDCVKAIDHADPQQTCQDLQRQRDEIYKAAQNLEAVD